MGEKRGQMPPAVAVACGVSGVLLTVFSVRELVINIALASRAQRAEGAVLESHHFARSIWEVKVRFRAGEQDVQFTERGSGLVMPSTGDQVSVLYDPGNPQEARIQSGIKDYVLPSLGLACSLSFCAPLLVVLLRRVAKGVPLAKGLRDLDQEAGG
jgi:hypothetical protein